MHAATYGYLGTYLHISLYVVTISSLNPLVLTHNLCREMAGYMDIMYSLYMLAWFLAIFRDLALSKTAYFR